MKFFFPSLTAALSLFSISCASIIEDHGYKVNSLAYTDSVMFYKEGQGYELITIIGFYPGKRVAAIHVANNDIEPQHEKKLGLGEIYNVLAGKHGYTRDDIEWVVFDVNSDPKTDEMVAGIRKDRGLGPKDEAVILPTDGEWDTILNTKYYAQAQQVNSRPLDRILLKHRSHPIIGKSFFPTERIHFSFPKLKDRRPENEAPSLDSGKGERQEDKREGSRSRAGSNLGSWPR
ncbi:hypothetical protein CFO_g4939 [Ceratocystis platani]|uniref:Uncharacterized protein n=1 Tax=Ceratocystis fimbriata f. sp. platani TaxID=88771 RepID=A0A0F8B052_CERFI|nr:hypothetical protein CFO_g4939 [Ceratocystis platani]